MKSVTSVVWSVIISMAFAGSCLAGAITLPWSNNLNCSAWTYNGSSETITSAGCKEFTAASDAGACGTYAQITAAANNGNIDSSGVGIRQYVGSATGSTGQTEATDGFVVTLPNPTKINIRWYERYQAGFQWSTISHHKDVYVWTATGAQYIIPTPMYSATQYVVGTYSGGQNYNPLRHHRQLHQPRRREVAPLRAPCHAVRHHTDVGRRGAHNQQHRPRL